MASIPKHIKLHKQLKDNYDIAITSAVGSDNIYEQIMEFIDKKD